MIHCDLTQPDQSKVQIVCEARPEFQPLRIVCDIHGVTMVVCQPLTMVPPERGLPPQPMPLPRNKP